MAQYIELANFPPDCPPSDSSFLEGIFYRLCNNPIDPTAFQSYRELGIELKQPYDKCRYCALSVLKDYDECAKILKLPARKGQCIMEVYIKHNHGAIQQTGKNLNHYSWWITDEFDYNTMSKLLG